MNFQKSVEHHFGYGATHMVPNKCMVLRVPGTVLAGIPFETPPCQTDLDADTVSELVASYERDPSFIWFRNTVVVAAVMPHFYLLDGQHRLAMLQKVAVPTPFNVVVYHISSEEDMRQLFRHINMDSHKSSPYVSMGIDQQRIRDELVLYLDAKGLFLNSRKKESRLYTARGFVEQLDLARFSTLGETIADLEAAHALFAAQVQIVGEPYVEEADCVVAARYFAPVKACNFLNFLLDRTVAPLYEGKTRRTCVPPKLRAAVWANEFGVAEVGKCPISGCTTVLTKAKAGFQCGHRTSHKNGGEAVEANLRPICGHCNLKMGSTDWDKYVPKRVYLF
jgi:hypothetical protein